MTPSLSLMGAQTSCKVQYKDEVVSRSGNPTNEKGHLALGGFVGLDGTCLTSPVA